METIVIICLSVCQENIQQSAEIDQLSTQLSELTKGHKTLQDEAAEVHVKITQERRVHVQVTSLVHHPSIHTRTTVPPDTIAVGLLLITFNNYFRNI